MKSVILVLNLGSEIISDVSDVSDVVLHHQGDVGGHGEGDLGGHYYYYYYYYYYYLGGQAARTSEHVQVPSREGQGHGLLHLNTDGLLLLENEYRELLSD